LKVKPWGGKGKRGRCVGVWSWGGTEEWGGDQDPLARKG